MYPDWLTADVTFPDGSLEGQLKAAQELVPESLLHDSGQAEELAECSEAGFYHLWMDTLHFIGVVAEGQGRDHELPAEFWVRVARAAHSMEFPQFVPYCLGKSKGLERQDPGDLIAAFSTMPDIVDVPVELRDSCVAAADLLREDDPSTIRMFEATDLGMLAAHLRGGAYDRLGGELSGLFSDAFDDLFALVTHPDFPAEHAKHAWAVIGPNSFRVVLRGGLFAITEAEPWWRAD